MTELVHKNLPAIPVSRILEEPMGRNTAPAIAWAATTIARQDPRAIMASFHADHVITNPEALQKALQLAYALAEQGNLVTLGINPPPPETGYGYIPHADPITY